MTVRHGLSKRPATCGAALAGVLSLAVVLASLAGCGGTHADGDPGNGVTQDTAQEALKAATEAAGKANSVTIKGHSSLTHGAKLKIDMQLTREGGHGSIDLLGSEYEVIRTSTHTYVKGPPVVYGRLGITKTIPHDTWVSLPATSQAGALLDLAPETSRIISTSGNVSTGSTTSIEGEPVLELKTDGKLYKGRLYIKTTGEPYPVKVERRGRETAVYTFSNWNDTPAPARPTKATSAGR